MTRALLFLSLLALVSLSCTFGLGDSPGETPTPTALPGEIVRFHVPIYSANLLPGENVKGTRMAYVGREGEVYNVTIDSRPAAKRVGDSFSWKGVLAPGVVADYNLRISPTVLGNRLLTAGSINIFVFNPIPIELDSNYEVVGETHRFSAITVDYDVATGDPVPGSSLIFEGMSDRGAQLSGTSDFPYRAVGDSVIWMGRLRGNVIVRYSLRVASINADRLRLVGTAELWITP